MQAIRVSAVIEERGRLVAHIPDSIEPGAVELLIITRNRDEDDAGENWMAGVAQEWQDELSDPRQDIYTLADGAPVE